ncbi:MAG: DUF3341 domain-containing protein [Candidatus Zixiibacteriota bacterium]
MSSQKKIHGMLAQFDNPLVLLRAAEKLRDAGLTKFDCHSPFPIHGMDEAMGLKRSPLGWMVGLMALIGGIGALALQWWTSAIDYPIIISGKPFFSYHAYLFVTFALAVLASAFTASIGMLAINGLPRLHHPVFYSERFAACSIDCFFVSVEKGDKDFDPDKTKELLQSLGGYNVELLES